MGFQMQHQWHLAALIGVFVVQYIAWETLPLCTVIEAPQVPH